MFRFCSGFDASNDPYPIRYGGGVIYTSHMAGVTRSSIEKRKKVIMVYGVGYCSVKNERYSNTAHKSYLTWRNMLKRCYSSEDKCKNYRELGVRVCEEWLDYSVFEKWFDRNYYEIPGEKMALDKDILTHGNLVYSPENCVFVPQRINQLFVRDKRRRGNLPIGVYYSKAKNVYVSSCSVNGNNVKSAHKTVADAFLAYKQIKEQHVKDFAAKYRGFIPEKLYNAMMMFEVLIND